LSAFPAFWRSMSVHTESIQSHCNGVRLWVNFVLDYYDVTYLIDWIMGHVAAYAMPPYKKTIVIFLHSWWCICFRILKLSKITQNSFWRSSNTYRCFGCYLDCVSKGTWGSKMTLYLKLHCHICPLFIIVGCTLVCKVFKIIFWPLNFFRTKNTLKLWMYWYDFVL
jgi:hypothetical protein